MSDLQLALLAGGAVLVAAVIAYNVWQERRARGRAEKAFGEHPGDALFEPEGGRREPTFGTMPPPSDIVEAGEAVAASFAPQELQAPGGPAAEISSRIDTVAVILADDPVMAEQLQGLRDALRSHSTPVHIEGIVDEQWHPVDSSPRRSWRELRVGLQLASRGGPVGEEEVEQFNQAIADFAAAVGAVSQREAPSAAAARARELDHFCAEADIEVAVNVVGQSGVTFAVPRVKSIAIENGMSETATGELASFTADGSVEYVIRRLDDAGSKPNASYYTGLTFALDLPQARDPVAALEAMVLAAETFARLLGGQLVDDNRRALSAAGIASIRRSLEKIASDMDAHGTPAGGALARRLFS